MLTHDDVCEKWGKSWIILHLSFSSQGAAITCPTFAFSLCPSMSGWICMSSMCDLLHHLLISKYLYLQADSSVLSSGVIKPVKCLPQALIKSLGLSVSSFLCCLTFLSCLFCLKKLFGLHTCHADCSLSLWTAFLNMPRGLLLQLKIWISCKGSRIEAEGVGDNQCAEWQVLMTMTTAALGRSVLCTHTDLHDLQGRHYILAWVLDCPHSNRLTLKILPSFLDYHKALWQT